MKMKRTFPNEFKCYLAWLEKVARRSQFSKKENILKLIIDERNGHMREAAIRALAEGHKKGNYDAAFAQDIQQMDVTTLERNSRHPIHGQKFAEEIERRRKLDADKLVEEAKKKRIDDALATMSTRIRSASSWQGAIIAFNEEAEEYIEACKQHSARSYNAICRDSIQNPFHSRCSVYDPLRECIERVRNRFIEESTDDEFVSHLHNCQYLDDIFDNRISRVLSSLSESSLNFVTIEKDILTSGYVGTFRRAALWKEMLLDDRRPLPDFLDRDRVLDDLQCHIDKDDFGLGELFKRRFDRILQDTMVEVQRRGIDIAEVISKRNRAGLV